MHVHQSVLTSRRRAGQRVVAYWACYLVIAIPAAAQAQDGSEDLGASAGDLQKVLAGATPQSLADMLLPQLGEAMGLPPKHSVIVHEEDRSSLRTVLRDIMQRQYPRDTLDRMNEAYQQLGLVPPGTNLRGEALQLYEGQVAGFYDPHSGRLALVRGASPLQQTQVLQHELAHALQDQYFSLQTLIDRVMRDEDQALALQAVVEGQAVVAMFAGAGGPTDNQTPTTREGARAALRDAGMEVSDEELDTMLGTNPDAQGAAKPTLSSLMIPDKPPAPNVPYLQAQLLFPYQEGTRFVEARLEHHSFPEVIAQTLGRPPRSTREVLHPDAYDKHVDPVQVPMSHLATIADSQVVYETTVGELNVRTLCGGPGLGDQAADGWRGDHLLGLRISKGVAAAWVSVWGSDADAIEFTRALAKTFAKRADSRHGDLFTRGSRVDMIVTQGHVVGVLAGVPAEQREAFRSRLVADMHSVQP